jgi:hypothetical protein
MSLLFALDLQKIRAAPDFKNQPETARCCFTLVSRERPLDGCASVHAFVHLAAQLVFSSEMIASQRFTKSDHFSGESAFTSPISAS